LATLALLACDKKAATDGPSSGASADADLVSPFAAAEARRAAQLAVIDAAPPPHLSYCHMDLGMCVQYTGLTAEEFQQAKEKCHGADAVFYTTQCSEADLLGTCDHFAAAEGVTDKAKMFLSKSVGFKSVEYARAFCEKGTFVAAPQVDAKAPVEAGRPHGK
jgi:hypothetical protein